jgi:hypothetical protein
MHTKATIFDFKDTNFFINFNKTPNITELKNDYAVWGNRKGVGGQDIPIHIRYAIDRKPLAYRTISVTEEELISYNQ